jgi:hypothetical protein
MLVLNLKHIQIETAYKLYEADCKPKPLPTDFVNPNMPHLHVTKDEWRKLGKYQKPQRTGKQWQLEDYCQYCTEFLIVRTEEDAEDPCVKCGIRDTIREELTQVAQAQASESLRSTQNK